MYIVLLRIVLHFNGRAESEVRDSVLPPVLIPLLLDVAFAFWVPAGKACSKDIHTLGTLIPIMTRRNPQNPILIITASTLLAALPAPLKALNPKP